MVDYEFNAVEGAVGSIVMYWGEIEYEINWLLNWADDAVIKDSRPHQFTRRRKAWRQLHITRAAVSQHIRDCEILHANIIDTRLTRDIIVHGRPFPYPFGDYHPSVHFKLEAKHKQLLLDDYNMHRKQLYDALPKDKAREMTELLPDWSEPRTVFPELQFDDLIELSQKTLPNMPLRIRDLNRALSDSV